MISVADPFLTPALYPGSGISKKIMIRIIFPIALKNFLGLKYSNSLMRIRIRDPGTVLILDPRSGMEKIRI
jgi:hypothetical protein